MNLLALEFPPISHLVEWPAIAFRDTVAELNKVGLIYLLAALVTVLLFTIGSKRKLVPTGAQNLVEMSLEFVEDGIIMQTIGPDGRKFLPFLTSLFFFIFFSNLTEVIPFIQFPANSRMAMPATLAILVFFVFNIIGIAKQGPVHYFKNVLLPPGVPGFLKPVVALIELVSTFLIRPFSLAVRLFANMLAGHLLLVTFAVLTAALWVKSPLVAVMPVSFAVLVALTTFEFVVAFLQAFIFTILTAVYIGGAMHPEH
ncbi:MAG: ATP synthase subunit a [Acidimicrobiales bacterium]|nr:MAG: ATP synthase subunit a [Acidimicrobiales bacterium]